MADKWGSFGVKHANFVIRFRWLVILATLLSVFAAVSGVRYLEFSTNYRIFFSGENPELNAFENFQDTYTKNDNIVFVIQPRKGDVFDRKLLEGIEELTEQAWQIPYSSRVDSITNFQYSWAEDDDLIVESLIENAAALSDKELAHKKQVALAEPLIRNNLLSKDARTTAINVTLQYPEKNIEEVPEAVAFVRQLADDFREQHPNVKLALTGVSMMNNTFAESGRIDFTTLVPLMYLVLVIMLLVMLRSISGAFTTLVLIFFSSLSAMGLGGYVGLKLTPISLTAPTIIMTLAIADAVHILVSMFNSMREGADKRTAIVESLRINLMPVTITSLTTVVGFLSLNFSDSPPFWHLGNLTAVGIAIAWVLSLVFLPALMAILPVRVKATQSGKSWLLKGFDGLANWIEQRYRAIVIGFGLVAIGLAAMVPSIELNDEFVKYFDDRLEFRRDSDFANEHLNGPYVGEYSVPAIDAGGISEPEYLQNLEKFTNWLIQQPEVNHVYSYVDIIKRLNRNLHGDDPQWYRIPEQRDLAAQYLLLYELSLPYGLDLNDRISVDKSATRVSLALKAISTIEIRAFFERAESWMQQNLPQYMQAKPTGATVMFSYISQRNIESMLNGNIFAVCTIALILILSLRNLKLGVISILPNTIPIVITFGIWSILVGKVGMAAATITATSLGIVVDDTVHFLSKYLRAKREKNLSAADSIRYAFQTVGMAIFATTMILTLGFSVLMFSSFLINFQMGLLTAMVIVTALIFDFVMLPALLLWLDKKKSKQVTEQERIYATD